LSLYYAKLSRKSHLVAWLKRVGTTPTEVRE